MKFFTIFASFFVLLGAADLISADSSHNLKVTKFGDGLRFSSDFYVGERNVGTHMTILPYTEGRVTTESRFAIIGGVPDFSPDLIPERIRSKIDVIFFPHPYHTVYCQDIMDAFPEAEAYGTRRHKIVGKLYEKLNALVLDSPMFPDYARARFPGFSFIIPEGLHFIHPENDSLHASGILIYHWSSASIHVDDTITGALSAGSFMSEPTFELKIHKHTIPQLFPNGGASYYRWFMNTFVGTPESDHRVRHYLPFVSSPFAADFTTRDIPGCEETNRKYLPFFPIHWFSSAHHVMIASHEMEQQRFCIPDILAAEIERIRPHLDFDAVVE